MCVYYLKKYFKIGNVELNVFIYDDNSMPVQKIGNSNRKNNVSNDFQSFRSNSEELVVIVVTETSNALLKIAQM